MGRMTLQGALRFDHAWSYSPEQIVGPTRFLPTPIVFPETAGVVGYNDISPRLGLAYDVFGNGKTALKVNLGRYLDAASNNNGNYSITNPTSRMAGSTELGRPPITRSWTDGNGELRSRLQPAQSRRAEQPGGRRRLVRRDQRSQLRHDDVEPELRSGGARGMGRASCRLGVRRVSAAGSAAARVGRGRLLPPVARQLLRGRQPRHGARLTSRRSASRRRSTPVCPVAVATRSPASTTSSRQVRTGQRFLHGCRELRRVVSALQRHPAERDGASAERSDDAGWPADRAGRCATSAESET